MNDRALVPVRPGELAISTDQPIDFEGLLKVGAMLAKSGFFPDAKVEAQAVAKILAGAELGVGPVASLRGIDLINGKLAPNAGLISALIKRRRPAYDFRIIENTNQRCELAFYEHGREIGRSSFSADDAKTAGLSGGNWAKFPRNMLFARALTNGARWYCADIFLGSIYVPEELGGDDDPPPFDSGEPETPRAPSPTPKPDPRPMSQASVIESMGPPKRNGEEAARKAFWGTATNLGYPNKRSVHAALGLEERDGALREWMESEGLSWDAVAAQLKLAGRYKPAAVEVDGVLADEYGDADPTEDDGEQGALLQVEPERERPEEVRRGNH